MKGFDLLSAGMPVPLSGGAQHLLAYLALQDRFLPRAYMAGVLWSDVTDSRAGGNLRSALWRLRQPGLELVETIHNCVRLAPQVAVDVREVNAIAKLLMRSAEVVEDADLERVAFAGDLLPGWYDDWIILERERHRQMAMHALEILCERWTAAKHFAKAVLAGLEAVAGEPLRESAYRVLIKAHLAEGNFAEAVRQYDAYRQALRSELNLDPSTQITELMSRLPTFATVG